MGKNQFFGRYKNSKVKNSFIALMGCILAYAGMLGIAEIHSSFSLVESLRTQLLFIFLLGVLLSSGYGALEALRSIRKKEPFIIENSMLLIVQAPVFFFLGLYLLFIAFD
ncbi:MAG: hypothetical protein ACFB10_03100 [Salibacteraceae bacterium]